MKPLRSRCVAAAASVVALAGGAVLCEPAARGEQPTFAGRVDLVTMGVTVTDRKGQPIANLAAEHFDIYEDGRRQTLRLFTSGGAGQGTPLHLGVLLDMSGSMERDLAFVRSASIRFVRMLPAAEDVTVVDFASEVRSARFGPVDPRLIERIRSQRAGGRTSLYDAVGVYLDSASAQDGRKVVVIYTDGVDTRSQMTLSELLDLLKASDVTAYAIGRVAHRADVARQEPRMTLQRMAEATGGQAFFPSSMTGLEAVYDRVLAEIRAQYTLGYLSTNERTDGAWREVEVKLAQAGPRDVRIRSRRGYYARLTPRH